MIRSTLTRRILSGAVLTAGIAATTAGIGAGPAQASAYGCTPYSDVRIKGVSPANWCGGPNGEGRTLDNVVASFASSFAGVGYLCDVSMKVEVFDAQGTEVYSAVTPTETGCGKAASAFRLDVNRTFDTNGYVATSLLSSGATLATLEHDIKA